MLQLAMHRSPWAVIGYSEELKKEFNENTRNFCLAIEERRRQLYST